MNQIEEIARLCEAEGWPDLSRNWERLGWKSQHGLWQGLMRALTPDFDYQARKVAGQSRRARLRQARAQRILF